MLFEPGQAYKSPTELLDDKKRQLDEKLTQEEGSFEEAGAAE